MKLLYVVYDVIAEEGGPIFDAPNDGVARRNYRQVLQNTKNVDFSEYKLYCVGSYDAGTMSVDGLTSPRVVDIWLNQEKELDQLGGAID